MCGITYIYSIQPLPPPKKEWEQRRQLHTNTTAEILVLGVGANLDQGYLGATQSFCAWISR